jgi:hypothetical protein
MLSMLSDIVIYIPSFATSDSQDHPANIEGWLADDIQSSRPAVAVSQHAIAWKSCFAMKNGMRAKWAYSELS